MKHKLCKLAAFLCAGGWSAVLLIAAAFPAETQREWIGMMAQAICGVLTVSVDSFLDNALPWMIAVCAFALLAVFWYWALPHYALSGGIAIGTAVATALLVGGQVWPLLLAQLGGAALGMACVVLWSFAWRRFPRVFNRETVSYVVFGVLTTVVNIVSYMVTVVILPFGEVVNTAVANAVAWVLSVLFAYVVNKLFVFRSHTTTAKAMLWEAGKFVGARIFSFGVDEVGMLLLVNVLCVPGFWAKVATNVLVMIMNYFFSKLIIFKGDK